MKTIPYYFSIAGFTIAVDFSNVKDKDVYQTLRNFLYLYYKDAIIPKNKWCRTNYTIYFTSNEQLTVIRNKVKKGSDNKTHDYLLRVFSFSQKHAYVEYHISIVQLQFLLKIIIQHLLCQTNGFLLHSSAVADKTHAYLFLGSNGAGKSTIVDNLRSYYVPYADDIVVVRYVKRKWVAYQFPIEKNNIRFISNNKRVIRAVSFIAKRNRTKFVKLSASKASKLLIPQIVGVKVQKKQVQDMLRFVTMTRHYYILECEKSPDVEKIQKFFKEI